MNDGKRNWRWAKEHIRTLRESLNRSQHAMAVLVGVTERTVFRREKGLSQPRRKAMRRLAQIERKLTQKSKEEAQRVPNINQVNILRIRKETEIIRRQTARVLEESWEKLRQTYRKQGVIHKS